jgi:hypothetical protein
MLLHWRTDSLPCSNFNRGILGSATEDRIKQMTRRITILEEHTTSDGLLKLSVQKFEDGVAIGFADLPWHTHPDLLVGTYGDDEEQALRGFISAILNDELLIVCSVTGDRLYEAWIEDNLQDAMEAASQSENVRVRYWSGWLTREMSASAAPSS